MEIAIVQTHRYPAITSTKAKFIRYSKQQKRVLALEYMHSAYSFVHTEKLLYKIQSDRERDGGK